MRIRIRLSMAVDMPAPRERANSMANHGVRANWRPLEFLALHRSPTYGHPETQKYTIQSITSVESISVADTYFELAKI